MPRDDTEHVPAPGLGRTKMAVERVGRHTGILLSFLLLVVYASHASPSRAALAVQQPRATALVDFRALDAAGEPVVDLKAADLVLRVGGRDRPVSSLEWISRRNIETPSNIAPPFATNSAVQSARGDIAVLIDEASIAPGREGTMRDAVASFLSRTSPRDRVRLISLRAVGPALPYEEGLRDVPAALARFTGHSTASESANDLVCRSQTAIEMLRSLFGNYAGNPIPTFVIVSGGFGSPPSGGVRSFCNY